MTERITCGCGFVHAPGDCRLTQQDADVYPCRECGQYAYEDEMGKCDRCGLGDLCTRCQNAWDHICLDCVGKDDHD